MRLLRLGLSARGAGRRAPRD